MLRVIFICSDHSHSNRIVRCTMKERQITKHEQSCISNCIYKYWGTPGVEENGDDEKRDRDYMQCLEDCQICG